MFESETDTEVIPKLMKYLYDIEVCSSVVVYWCIKEAWAYEGLFCEGLFYEGLFNEGLFNEGLFCEGLFNEGLFCEGLFYEGLFNEGLFNAQGDVL